MGLFDGIIKNGEVVFDRIKYDGPQDSSMWLVYKYPKENFVLGSQLIVNQGQEALFFKGGEALDLFGAGTHTLQTGNLPLLHKLVNQPFGGNTPFAAEIYYVNKTSRLNMNWGTAQPFSLEDPKYGLILSIRCHGTYGLRISDTRMFVTELIGAALNGVTITHEFVASYFSGLLTSKIKNIVSSFMIRQKISFLEITGYLDDLSRVCQESLSNEFERFGAEIVNFYVETISPPKDEYEKLRNYKEELSMGEGFYNKRRSFDILEGMANNESSGGLANVGAGLGMGLGVVGGAGNVFTDLGSNINIHSQTEYAGGQVDGNVCPHCGVSNVAGQKFCGSCGKPLIAGIVCLSCGKINSFGQMFCGNCGEKLMKRCASCGQNNDFSQKFCGNCGAAI